MENVQERVRKIDPETLSEEQAKIVEDMLAKKLNEIIDMASKQANKYFNIYGIEVLFQVGFKQQEEPKSVISQKDFSEEPETKEKQSLKMKPAKASAKKPKKGAPKKKKSPKKVPKKTR